MGFQKGWRKVGEYQTKVKLFYHPFLDNTPLVPVQAGFDKVLMNHSQPSQLQMFKVQPNRW
jgi:hypothetical protein